MEEEKTVIELDDESVALVITGDGTLQLYLPNPDDKEEVASDNVVLGAAMAVALENEDLVEQILANLDKVNEEKHGE